MERWSNRVAVVTGASAGIGVEVVKDLLKANLIVVGLARRLQIMEAYKPDLPAEQQKRFHTLACDISSLESVNKTFDWIVTTLGGVDILVNNAGILLPGLACTMDPLEMQQLMQINVMGVVFATQRAFKSMKERNVDGHVVLVNSLSGHSVNIPNIEDSHVNMYAPSKYAITALTDVYRQEFKGLGAKVKVTSVSPGATDTSMIDYAKGFGIAMLKAEDVSRCILFALSTPPHVQIREIKVEAA
ncbi:farnesol dehydrogenase-like [Eurosta solidaginis]|uniref:farnesol dehydrogenase-like n=1 Tax=Eurosta solidaginis TaxID=178769 RepID=UPI003531255C